MADTKRALAPDWAMNTRSIFLKRLGLLMEYIGASGELECEINGVGTHVMLIIRKNGHESGDIADYAFFGQAWERIGGVWGGEDRMNYFGWRT